jgi:hypothetical protein
MLDLQLDDDDDNDHDGMKRKDSPNHQWWVIVTVYCKKLFDDCRAQRTVRKTDWDVREDSWLWIEKKLRADLRPAPYRRSNNIFEISLSIFSDKHNLCCTLWREIVKRTDNQN